MHFLDAWEHATGESLWDRDMFRNWKTYLAHALLPDGQNVFDFGDIWEGALTRAKAGAEYARVYPGGTLQSNYNVMYRVAARLRDPQAQAVAERYASFGHSNLEEFWTLLWRDPVAEGGADGRRCRSRITSRTRASSTCGRHGTRTRPRSRSRPARPRAIASRALLPTLPEWRLDSGHAHPDAGSFIMWAHGRYLTGDTGYAGLPSARNHNTMTFGGVGQGVETQHDVWRADGLPRARRHPDPRGRARRRHGRAIVADLAAAYPPTAGVDGVHAHASPGTADRRYRRRCRDA